MTKKNILLLLGLLISLTGYSQSVRQKLAGKYADRLYYYDANIIYNELARKTVKTRNPKKKDWNMVRKAAETCSITEDYKGANQWYAHLKESGQMTETDWLNYMRTLVRTGNGNEAEQLARQQIAGGSASTSYQHYARYSELTVELMKDSMYYKVKEAPFNSGSGDFASAYLWQDGMAPAVVFVSQRRNTRYVSGNYHWNNKPYLDSYYAKCTDTSQQTYSRKAKLLKRIFKTGVHDGPIYFLPDGKTAVITRNQNKTSAQLSRRNLGLFIATKSDKNKWSKPVSFQHNSIEYSVGHASLTPDGQTMYFCSNMPGGYGGSDLYICHRNGNSWSKPENLGAAVNSPGDELFPFIAADGDLYFSSNGHPGLGGLDIFRAPKDQQDTPPANMGYPINTHADDFGLVLSGTGNQGFFSSNRKNANDHIYQFTMEQPTFRISLRVVDQHDEAVSIPQATVMVMNLTSGKTEELYSDSAGYIQYALDRNSEYAFISQKEGYRALDTATISTLGQHTSAVYTENLHLEEKNIAVHITVLDKTSGTPLPYAKVYLSAKDLSFTKEFICDSTGSIHTLLPRDMGYTAEGKMRSYKEGNIDFSTGDHTHKSEDVELALEKIKKGDVLVINNIYYDYNKATLRDSSKMELDKLAGFLIENNNIKVELGSHSDSRGADGYNLSLSLRRAQSAVTYLISKGVKSENIVAKGYGETRLINRCGNGVQCTEAEHQVNRRTEIRILNIK